MPEEVIGIECRIGAGMLSELLDLLPDYFYVTDSNVRLVYANKAAAEYFRLSKDQLLGKSFMDVEADTEFARQVTEVTRKIMATGKPHVADVGPYNEPDGTQSFLRRYDIPFHHPQTGEQMALGLVQDMTDRVERERQKRDLAAMDREMQIARDIQRSVFPKELRTDWADLFGFSEPAAYAGGDFYDWRRLPDGSVVVVLGDVAGHGVGPALVAAQCQAYWRVLAPSLPLQDAVLRLNKLIVDDRASERFVTFAAAKLSPRGSLEVFSAGHGPLILRRQHGDIELLDSHTLPLGIEAELPFSDNATTRDLGPGDTLLLYSDGFTETQNPQGEQWTTQGLLNTLSRNVGRTGPELLREIERENVEFAQNAAPADDRTIVLAGFQGRSSGTPGNRRPV